MLVVLQKAAARADVRSKKTGHTDVRVFHEIEKQMGGGSTFLGYTEEAAEGTVQALLDLVEDANIGVSGLL